MRHLALAAWADYLRYRHLLAANLAFFERISVTEVDHVEGVQRYSAEAQPLAESTKQQVRPGFVDSATRLHLRTAPE